jgi:hypothetical protein
MTVCLFMTALTEFSVLYPQLWGKCHGDTRKDGARPALFLIFMLLYVFCVVLCIVCFMTFPVLFLCICVLNNCHRVTTKLQLNMSYHIIYEKGREYRGGLGSCSVTYLSILFGFPVHRRLSLCFYNWPYGRCASTSIMNIGLNCNIIHGQAMPSVLLVECSLLVASSIRQPPILLGAAGYIAVQRWDKFIWSLKVWRFRSLPWAW